jgi:hypothetical protein
LYKLDSKTLKQHSGMFRQMFAMPPAPVSPHSGQAEGASEDNPIVLLGVKEPEFDVFVSQVYGRYVDSLFVVRMVTFSIQGSSPPT